MLIPFLLIQSRAAALATADFRAVGQNVVADTRMLAAAAADEHDVRNVDRPFFFHDAALDIFLRVRPGMPLDDFTCSTTMVFFLALIESTRPLLPASRPATTFTLSPL